MGSKMTGRKKKAIKAVSKLLPPGAQVRDYFTGRSKARWTTGATVAISVFGVLAVVAAMFGTILIPGGLLLVFISNSVRPPRGVAVTDDGIIVVGMSAVTGRPTRIVQHVRLSEVSISLDGKTMGVPGEQIDVARRDRSSAGPAIGAARTAQPAPPAAWYPDPSGAPGMRYWDGTTWTEHRAEADPSPLSGGPGPSVAPSFDAFA